MIMKEGLNVKANSGQGVSVTIFLQHKKIKSMVKDVKELAEVPVSRLDYMVVFYLLIGRKSQRFYNSGRHDSRV